MKIIVAIFVLIIVGVFAVVSAFMPKIYCYNNEKEGEKDNLIYWKNKTVKNKNFRERYKKITQSKWFKRAYKNMRIGEQIKIEE